MQHLLKWGMLILFALALVALSVYLSNPSGTTSRQTGIKLSDVLGDINIEGYTRAFEPREFSFPADHGLHPGYKHEWWYFTGNLATPQGRHFGFQLTFFRIALAPHSKARDSAWATNQIYMAHFTLTDVENKKFYNVERFSRAGLGLADATAQPFKVWLEDWSAAGQGAQTFPLHLRAANDNIAIDLHLDALKPVVLQGDKGLSQKSGEPGNASYYYSLTRLGTTGTVRVGEKTFPVSGLSWMDREWSTSALSKEQAGWDWFSLQLSDGRDVMFYRLRRKDGQPDPHSAGALIAPDGTKKSLSLQVVQIASAGEWRSPHSGIRYPVRWRLRIPSEKLDLQITPYLADQEINVSVRYWEGAVRIEGIANGKPIKGNGYVEMTGYS